MLRGLPAYRAKSCAIGRMLRWLIGVVYETSAWNVNGEGNCDVARDWSKSRRRDAAARERRYAAEDALAFSDPPEASPSKAQMRDELAELLDGYKGRVKRLPTFAALRCRACGHRGNARVPRGMTPKFRCSACGSTLIAWRI
jgi:hypothetical protein